MTDLTEATGRAPRDMAELFASGTQDVAESNSAVQAAGLVGLLSVLTTVLAVVVAVVVTVLFFAVVLGGLAFAFGAGLPLR